MNSDYRVKIIDNISFTKKVILLVLIMMFIISSLHATSIGTEESYSNSNSYSNQKNKEKSFSKTKEKTKTKEKGIEKNKNKSLAKEKSIENSFLLEKSHSLSKMQITKSTISISLTQLMPEVDYLINRILNDLINPDKYFIEHFPLSRDDMPENVTKLPMLSQFHPSIVIKTERFLIKYLSHRYRQYIIDYIHNYINNFKITVGATAGLSNISIKDFNGFMQNNTMYDFTLGANYWIILNGDIRGKMIFSFDGAMLDPLFLRVPAYNLFISYNPMSNIFEMIYKNRKIIYLSNDKIAHFYGDLILTEDYNNNNILVIDQKIGADGLYLDKRNSHFKFDDYFKKLMKLYLEAFNHLENKIYSVEEVKFLIRRYIYKKISGKNDFFKRYINDPTDFWRPKKDDLINYPLVRTSFNDIIFDKKDGIILNRRVFISIEKSSSIDEKFNRLFKNQVTRRFAQTIAKTISYFEKENKQELARLTKSLAIRFVNSKNFVKKQDLINKAMTSTDVLHTLINILK